MGSQPGHYDPYGLFHTHDWHEIRGAPEWGVYYGLIPGRDYAICWECGRSAPLEIDGQVKCGVRNGQEC